jgi:carbon starvation protein CstA
MGEVILFARTGGAPSLAFGVTCIFASAFGSNLLALWYRAAIMFEVLFSLTTLNGGHPGGGGAFRAPRSACPSRQTRQCS